MRRLLGNSRSKSRLGLSPAARFAMAVWFSAGIAAQPCGAGQMPQPTQPSIPSAQSGSRSPFGPEPDISQEPMVRRALEEAAKKRNIERQNRLVADSDRIVLLAQELSAAIGDGGQSPPISAITGKAAEIEKLARSVEQRMKAE